MSLRNRSVGGNYLHIERPHGTSCPPSTTLNQVARVSKRRGRQGCSEALQERCEPRTLCRFLKAPKLRFGVAQDLGMKPHMEDRHAVMRALHPTCSGQAAVVAPPSSIAAIFDGHGGQKAVEFAAKHLPQEVASHALLNTELDQNTDEAVEYALKSAYSCVDEKLLNAAQQEPLEWRDGSTALVALQRGRTLFTANAGDCRAVMCRHGKEYRLTRDHTPSDPDERRRIRLNGGKLRFFDRWRVLANSCALGVSRALGDFQFKFPQQLVSAEPEVVSTSLMPGDSFVILASDGLWDVMSDAEAVVVAADLLSGCTVMGGSGWQASDFWADMAAKALVDEAVERGANDNITALVVLLDWQDEQA